MYSGYAKKSVSGNSGVKNCYSILVPKGITQSFRHRNIEGIASNESPTKLRAPFLCNFQCNGLDSNLDWAHQLIWRNTSEVPRPSAHFKMALPLCQPHGHTTETSRKSDTKSQFPGAQQVVNCLRLRAAGGMGAESIPFPPSPTSPGPAPSFSSPTPRPRRPRLRLLPLTGNFLACLARHLLITLPNCTSSPQFNRPSVAARFSALQR